MSSRVSEPWAAVVLAALFVGGCGDLRSCDPSERDEALDADPGPPAVAGMACDASRDCATGQVCVAGACRPLRTSVEGELLAESAKSLLEAGHAFDAHRTYTDALRAFERRRAAAPPSVLCGSAEAALASPREEVPRELGARLAYGCFHGSLPGDASRERVLARVAEMRDEGLDLAAFDEPELPAEFFTAPRRRLDPTKVQVEVERTAEAGPASEALDARLQSPEVARAVVACFLEDWALHHRRSAVAALPLRIGSRLRDMGSYDLYEARVEVDASGLGDRGFAPCAARALAAGLAEPIRVGRSGAWQATATVRASAR